jgi:hypothetical protein
MTQDEWDRAEADRVRKNQEVIATLRGRGCEVHADGSLALTPRPYPGKDPIEDQSEGDE